MPSFKRQSFFGYWGYYNNDQNRSLEPQTNGVIEEESSSESAELKRSISLDSQVSYRTRRVVL